MLSMALALMIAAKFNQYQIFSSLCVYCYLGSCPLKICGCLLHGFAIFNWVRAFGSFDANHDGRSSLRVVVQPILLTQKKEPHVMRPEHVHYDTIERWIRESVNAGDEFLFEPERFRNELRKMWEKYEIPYEVTCSSHS